MSRSGPVTRLRGNKTPAAPLSPITEKSSPLSNFPLSSRPSPTVSRTWVHDNVTIARGSKRKLADRQVDTVLAAFRLERHGALSASAVASSNEIPASQRDHARRLDFLQTTWPQGNIIPLRFLDPFNPELSWHLVNDLYFITKAFIKANIPLSVMWEDPVADNSLSPQGLLVRQMTICHVSHITTKVTQSARREVKSPGWPLLTPPQPLVSGAPSPKPIRQRAVSVSPKSSPLHHRPPASRPAPRAHSVPLPNMLAQRPEDGRNERLQTAASDKRSGSHPLGLDGMDFPMPADDKEGDNGMLFSIPPAHDNDNDDDWVSDDAPDSDPGENETPEQSRRARAHSTGTNGLDEEIGQPVFAFPPSTPEIKPSPFHFSTTSTEMSPLLDDQSRVNDLISGLPSSPLPVAEGVRPTSLPQPPSTRLEGH
ncbi:hypothetical protein ColLi_12689 [Colletotrichum liriopes]|uniref:Uncharacterized protein n=1 Tax=Colletotrichum liriopes TaxID=708192 RepID=A0AA37GYU6_9PEZI|nr:hypothetical protein ColLi_12689 [Colletotrichum liriopes]